MLEIISQVATAIGVIIAAWQLWENRKIAQTSFEDSLDKQFRSLAMNIPVNALIGKTIDGNKNNLRELIYNYLDLCNEQVYLRKINRISKSRWKDWNDGIRDNLNKPEFKVVWEEIKNTAPNTFTALECLEKMDFKIDPARCKNCA
ncbi:MAG: hypothetical protein JXB49_00055 [Bacteroidales bacterium]|nr:hypothetical protein [Bacteroidales bacterium]